MVTGTAVANVAGRRATPTPETPTPGSLISAGKEVLGLGAAVGAVVFLVLSVMYDRFYGPLGLEPEDVGRTRVVIIEHAAAGVLAIVGVGIAVFAGWVVLAVAAYGLTRVTGWGLYKTFGREQSTKLKKMMERQPFKVLASFMYFPAVARAENPLQNRTRLALLSCLFTVVLLGGTIAVGWRMVGDAAEEARAGGDVTPMTFAGLPILEIESTPCTVHWLAAAELEPDELRTEGIHCLGESNGSTLFRTDSATVRVPTSSVSTSFD
jgi:hypothetical protein